MMGNRVKLSVHAGMGWSTLRASLAIVLPVYPNPIATARLQDLL